MKGRSHSGAAAFFCPRSGRFGSERIADPFETAKASHLSIETAGTFLAPEVQMRSNTRNGAGNVVTIGFATLPLLVMGWVSYSTGLSAFS